MAEVVDVRPVQEGTTKPEPVVVDKRGRIAIPARIRKELQIEPGDTFFAVHTSDGILLASTRKIQAELEKVALEYLEKEGPVVSLEDFCKQEGIDLDSIRKRQTH